jgi:hypothetical protein
MEVKGTRFADFSIQRGPTFHHKSKVDEKSFTADTVSQNQLNRE